MAVLSWDVDMRDQPITGNDAKLYIEHVGKHDLKQDTAWLIDSARFPVGCRVLDVGCGSGTLTAVLADDKRFARSVVGVELSEQLAIYAQEAVNAAGGTVVQADFLSWSPPAQWQPDAVVMSFFLHHTHDASVHLKRAASLLAHGGRLYIFDRMATNESALRTFPRYWEKSYRAAHEWREQMPRLMTVEGLTTLAQEAGFTFVQRQVCPHDRREGAELFPKTLLEFWRQEPGRSYPALLLVSPAHRLHVDDICRQLVAASLSVAAKFAVGYADDLIRTIYERCPWREILIGFIRDRCPDRTAVAVQIGGDDTTAGRLHLLSQFKSTQRNRWGSIEGAADFNGFRPIILPFHVPEPYEAEMLARLVIQSAVAEQRP